MRVRRIAVIALFVAFCISVPSSFADHGKGNGKGNKHADRFDHDRDDDRWEHHGKYEVRIFDVHDARPTGWSQGKKTGWGNCGLPPGQAKKYGCRTYVYQKRRYYYYEDEVGRIIVRRPSIEVHAVIR
jgi:hypothetical protein